MVSSDISTNSKSRIFLTILGGRDAAGLYGPWAPMGSGTIGGGRVLLFAVAAAMASRLSPEDSADPGLKVGVFQRVCSEVRYPGVGSMLRTILVVVSRRGLREA